MSFALLTWAMITLKENQQQLKGPPFAAAQSAVLKMRQAAYRLRNQLGMPVPLPYLHALTILQNVTFALYSYAFLSFDSVLTPIILLVVIVVTVGMREVAVALSNPFGKDDVDFPVDKWISTLRSIALVVHRDNVVCTKPTLNRDLGKPQVPPKPQGSANGDDYDGADGDPTLDA